MNILSLCELFTDLIGQQVYVINFPEYTEGNFIKFEIISGVQESGGVYDFNVQFMVKGQHPSEAEGLALNVLNNLDMVTDIEFNNNLYQLILSKATSPQPYYVGETEAGEYIFSLDFRLLVNKL